VSLLVLILSLPVIRQYQSPQQTKQKNKVLPYSLPSVEPGADPGVQAVSPQVTLSYLPGGRLPLLYRPGLRLPP